MFLTCEGLPAESTLIFSLGPFNYAFYVIVVTTASLQSIPTAKANGTWWLIFNMLCSSFFPESIFVFIWVRASFRCGCGSWDNKNSFPEISSLSLSCIALLYLSSLRLIERFSLNQDSCGGLSNKINRSFNNLSSRILWTFIVPSNKNANNDQYNKTQTNSNYNVNICQRPSWLLDLIHGWKGVVAVLAEGTYPIAHGLYSQDFSIGIAEGADLTAIHQE